MSGDIEYVKEWLVGFSCESFFIWYSRGDILSFVYWKAFAQREVSIMTDKQKEQIKALRQRGMGYIRVAQALGISENTIKSFCRRNKLTGEVKQEKLAAHFCFYCGATVTQTPHRKEKKFCSNTCRMKWWNAHFDKLNKKTMYPYICPHCGKGFEVYGNSHRKYCSHACYIADRFQGGERNA